MHSRLSPDSEMDPAAAVLVLRRNGLGGCFTEHVDYAAQEGRDPLAADAPRDTEGFLLSDPDAYPDAYDVLRAKDVTLGLEIGLTAAYRRLNEAAAAKDGLDFIIGSVHFVDGWDIGRAEYPEHEPEPCRRYLQYTREMIELSGFFDSLGHIDYYGRYAKGSDAEARYADFAAEYDAVFRALAERDKALEINTARFGDPRAEANLYHLCRRFASLGGRFVTIGSDAHDLRRVGRCHARACKMARETGLTAVWFKGRERQLCR